MHKISVENGRLVVDPEDDVWALPIVVTEDLMAAVFACEPHEDGHIANLFHHLSTQDRARFSDACMAHPEYSVKFSVAYFQWAAVGSSTQKWSMKDFKITYQKKIGSWLIDIILVDATSRSWYAVNDKGIWSEQEFEFTYGSTIQDHLRRYSEERLVTVEQAIRVMEEPLVAREIVVADKNTGAIQTITVVGPPSVTTDLWVMPAGFVFVNNRVEDEA